LAAPPVPEPAILEPPASAAVSATAPADPIEPSPAKASIVPPKLKPTPKKPAAEQSPAAPIDLPPAPVEATPSPIEATPATIEDPPAPTGAAEAAIEATPAPVLFTAPPIESPVETPSAAAPEPVAEPTIVAARVTRAAVAVYPERCATRAGEKVGVSVLFSVTTEGKPISASVVASDNRCFNTAAVRAVYDMRFSPRTIDGAPAVETGKTVTVQFVR
jgi:TonB family protein